MNDLEHIISQLIATKTEGGYWDFKRSWHENNADLLHDIICMANNIENRDAYIIIGVTNSGEFNDISTDKNRKKTEHLISFLRTKRFVGQFRPIVKVETISISENNIDVIVIENTTNTPYVLEDDFQEQGKVIRQGNIYTRIQDTNTPVNKTADYDKVEKLWRKRFFLDASPFEKLEYYLKDTHGWEMNSNQNEWYYKYSNELFRIRDLFDVQKEEKTETVWDYIGTYLPFLRHKLEIIWQNVVIKTFDIISNCKYSTIMPDFPSLQFEGDTNAYCYWCFMKNSSKELLQRIIERDHSNPQIMDFDFYPNIICFDNANEKIDFEDYLRNNWGTLKKEFEKIEDSKDITNRIFQNDYKCTMFFPKVFKPWKEQRPNN